MSAPNERPGAKEGRFIMNSLWNWMKRS